MKVHPVFVAAFLGAWLSIQGWALYEISTLKEQVAVLTTRMNYHYGDVKQAYKHE